MHDTLLIIFAYLLGSIPSAVWISRLFGLKDPRTFGSGNPGTTNVLRSGNKLAALLTLIVDIGKGFMAIFLPTLWTDHIPQAMMAIAVVVGHMWSVFLRFRGGKGVATSAGALLAMQPWLGAAVIAVWIFTAAVFRYSSLAAVVAALSAPLWVFLFHDLDLAHHWAVVVIAILVIIRSRNNLLRLWQGVEPKFGSRTANAGDKNTRPYPPTEVEKELPAKPSLPLDSSP